MTAEPRRFGRYELRARLGAGGMGEVWVGFDPVLERRVAVKLVAQGVAHGDVAARMLREARAASALDHPAIVKVFEIAEDNGRVFIVMELVEGETFAALLARRGRLSPAEALALVESAGDGLAAAHEAGVLHRDIKCANLMATVRGGAKVLDFGLSKRRVDFASPASADASAETLLPASAMPSGLLAQAKTFLAGVTPASDVVGGTDAIMTPSAPFGTGAGGAATPSTGQGLERLSVEQGVRTAHGTTMGTPGYAALELLIGEEADERSDVYSLAVVLYELVTGRRPYRGASFAEIIRAMTAEQVSPASIASEGATAPALDALMTRSLAADRARRPASVRAFLAEARAAIAPASPASPASPAAPAPTAVDPRALTPRTRSNRLVLAALAAVALAALAVTQSRHERSTAPARPAVAAALRSAVTLDVPTSPASMPPPSSSSPPRQLTRAGGCAFAPVFAAPGTVAYDLSHDHGTDLYAVPLDGGESRRLTTAKAMDWRAAAGRRAGELLFITAKDEQSAKMHAAALDLATLAVEPLPIATATAVAVGDAVYYARFDQREVHRWRGGADESVLTLPAERGGIYSLTASRDGRWLALMSVHDTEFGQLCVVDLSRPVPVVDCPAHPPAFNGRPDFSADGASVFLAGSDGLLRLTLADGSVALVAPGVRAPGGIAVAPDGASLVYSSCEGRVELLALGNGPPRVLLGRAENPASAEVGPDGTLAFVRARQGAAVLVVRLADGTTRELTAPALGSARDPAFDTTGRRLVFAVDGPRSGAYVVEVDGMSPAQRIVAGSGLVRPLWLRDGRVVYTVIDDAAAPGLLVVDPDGGAPAPMPGLVRPRVTLAVNPVTGELLLRDITRTSLYLFEATTGAERRLPAIPAAAGRIITATITRDGKQVLASAGPLGNDIWALPVESGEARVIYRGLSGGTMYPPTTLPDGTVVVAPVIWSGELFALDGRF